MIVTSEGCFKYFSKAYNVPSAYIWEINTEEEGTPDQIKHLVEKLRTTKVPSLFVESSVDDRPMKTVSKDTNIPIYSTIFTDSIAEKGQDGDSYYAMMKWNLDTKLLKAFRNNLEVGMVQIKTTTILIYLLAIQELSKEKKKLKIMI